MDQPVLLGFILNTNPQLVHDISLEIINSIQGLDGDERAYIYQPNNNYICRWVGEAVGVVANYRSIQFSTSQAVKETISMFSEMDINLKKYVFVITDRILDFHKLKNALRLNVKGINEPSEVFLFDIGNSNELFDYNCNHFHYMQVESKEISTLIKSKYQGD